MPKRLSQDVKTRDILFVGPHRGDFDAVKQSLATDGPNTIEPYWATTVSAALKRLERKTFEAILLDRFLPDADGLLAVAALRAAAPHVPVAVFAVPEDQPARTALKWGAHDYLTKGDLQVRTLSDALETLIDRKTNEEALFAEKERAEVTLNSIGDAVLSTDTWGRITYLNPVAERMTGWSLDDAVGQPGSDVFRIIDGDTREPVRNPLQTALRHNKTVALAPNSLLVRRDGSEAAIEDSVAPIHDRSGNVTGAVAVFHDVSEASAQALKMSHLAYYDFLTDLPNRVLLNDRLAQAIAMARRHQRQLAILFVDCDNFKDINDALGHATGDLLLQSVAKRLVATCRSSDTVSRQGGDEFVILLSELESPEAAGLCAAKILAALATPHRIGSHDLHLTASIGIAVYPLDGRNAESMVRCADTALYEAKAKGSNKYRFFRRNMKTRAVERRSIEGTLLRALEREEFRLHYQPRVSLATGAVLGVEALLRWDHPERGLVSPAEFVPAAEESGLIVPIGRWVLGEACRQAAAWQTLGFGFGSMAVNVSAVELRSAAYLDGVTSLLAESTLGPDILELELTESVLMQDTDVALGSLNSLKQLGIRLTLDDFGTGYASLSYLRRFPITTLKIDRAFVQDLTDEAGSRSLVAAIVAMGKSLGQTLIAEGIETEHQLGVLRDMDCDQGQGFHFCRPLPAADLTTYLAASAAGLSSITPPNPALSYSRPAAALARS